MKILLTRDARIKHFAGETVEATQAEAEFLIGIGSAVAAQQKQKQEKVERKTRKK